MMIFIKVAVTLMIVLMVTMTLMIAKVAMTFNDSVGGDEDFNNP